MKNIISKEIKNNDGSIDQIIISSSDNLKTNINKNYKIANHYEKTNSLNNGVLLSEIGIKDKMFRYVFSLSLVMVIISLVIMFYNYRVY